jgi:hypothetical protein
MTLNPIDASFDDDDLREMFSGEIPRRKQIAFYLDENLLAAKIRDTLTQAGVYVTSVRERGMEYEDSDYIVLSDAREIDCLFVTLDQGFEEIHFRVTQLEGSSHAGIVLFGNKYDVDGIAKALSALVQKSQDYPVSYRSQLVKYGVQP